MDTVTIEPVSRIGHDFIPPEYIPEGKDEYYIRNEQSAKKPSDWRRLTGDEVRTLVNNGNTADDWDSVLVSRQFEPDSVKNSEFHGLVRIGALSRSVLRHHDLLIPSGITNSRIVSCDIGDDVAIHDVRYLAHYIIGNRCVLMNIDEMHTTDHAKFGNGIVKQGEPESVRVWIELMNETGSRSVLPFDGMIPADAYLWAKYRDDAALQRTLTGITQASFDPRRGFYGTVGDQCVIKSCRIIKDAKIGPHSYIKGANKLKNITIRSSAEEPVQVGEGVELVNGIVGYGCHVFYGCKAVRFVLCTNSSLKYGARLLNSMLGENSTVSCCEMLNNLIFPAHEQHHNNSFLVAALIMGQSNLAAGATVGSNHNSRANDNEVQAGRGFWPGLCTTIKHSSRFASFTLMAKGDYPAELDIALPFSLVNNNASADRIEIIPAFWWLYNMYALARNAWKFNSRDKRKIKTQHIEFDYLAPDTIEEILAARRLLEAWTAKALRRQAGRPTDGVDDFTLAAEGARALDDDAVALPDTVPGERIEKSRRTAVVLKVRRAYRAYADMLVYYGVTNLFGYLAVNPGSTLTRMAGDLAGPRETAWINMGGQLVPAAEVDRLRQQIGSGALASWDAIHRRYDELWEAYPRAKQRHAFAALCAILGAEKLTPAVWRAAVDRAVSIQRYIGDQVYASRKKDYDNPFRRMTYRSDEEMTAAIGTIDDNSFIRQVRAETGAFEKLAESMKTRI